MLSIEFKILQNFQNCPFQKQIAHIEVGLPKTQIPESGKSSRQLTLKFTN